MINPSPYITDLLAVANNQVLQNCFVNAYYGNMMLSLYLMALLAYKPHYAIRRAQDMAIFPYYVVLSCFMLHPMCV